MVKVMVWSLLGILLLPTCGQQSAPDQTKTSANNTIQSPVPRETTQPAEAIEAVTDEPATDEPAAEAPVTETPLADAAAEIPDTGELEDSQTPFDIPATTVVETVPTKSPQEVTITLARPTWDTGWFQAAIYKQLLERMGYTVNGPYKMDTDIFYRRVAEGSVDMWPNGWFPLHNRYLEDIQTEIEVIGSELRGGALQGYLIDKTTADEHTITNLKDLQDPLIAALFDTDGNRKANLIGCEPHLGCHTVIEHHLDAYGLRDTVEHTYGNYEQLMRDTIERFKSGEPVLFYTWTPNWTVGTLQPGSDVVWLEVPFPSLPEEQRDQEYVTEIKGVRGCATDPCDLGFPPNDIRVVANSTFLDENPRIRRLLELVEIPGNDIAAQNSRMFRERTYSEEDIERHAREWIEDNANLINSWTDEEVPFIGGGLLQWVKARGYVRCGVDKNFKGFSVYNEETQTYQGFNVDFCRVIATAIFNDPEAVEIIRLDFQESFQAVSDRKVDILLNNTTWTAVRDAGMDQPHSGIRLRFGPTIFHDGQRFMVRKTDEITAITPDAASRSLICVQKGTTSEQNINDRFGATRIGIKSYEDVNRVYRMYEQGVCDAVTADTTELTARLLEMETPDEHTILPDTISREPLGPVVIEGDDEWSDVVNWSIFATMYAEELEVNSTNCDTLREESNNPDIQRLLGVRGEIGKKLGLDNDFAYNIICTVGNYGEIYNRNLGPGTALNIERGPNKIWNQGGVLNSPPFR